MSCLTVTLQRKTTDVNINLTHSKVDITARLSRVCNVASKYIRFADPIVEALCVANWSSDGVGLTKEDAANVTTLGNVFRANTDIAYFDELQYFTGLTKIYNSSSVGVFDGCTNLKSVKIPASVTEIGLRSFANCNALTDVGSLENVEIIGDIAFANTNALAIVLNIPKLREIQGKNNFTYSGITGIESLGSVVNIPDGTAYNNGVFAYCSALAYANLNESTTYIGAHSFRGCTSLSQINSSSSVTTIGADAFSGCTSLQSICLDNVISIGDGAFRDCGALTIALNAPYLETLEFNAFKNSGITAISSIGKVTKLDAISYSTGIFENCKNLTSANLRGVTYIGYRIFYGCNILASIDIDWTKVTNIGPDSLNGCTSLAMDELNAESLTYLGQNALNGVKIKKLNLGKATTLPTGSTSTQNYGDKSVLEEITIPIGVTSIPQYSFYNYTLLSRVNVDWNKLLTIAEGAFTNCPIEVDSLSLNSLTGTLGISAFYGTKVRKLLGTGSATTLGSTTTNSGTSGCFQNCLELIEATLSNGLQYIGKHCFRDTAISEITVPNSVIGISGNAFNSCDNLTTVDIGSGCESIGASVFEYCRIIEKVICRASVPPSLGAYAFRNTNSTFLIYVPDASLEAYKTATNWSTYADRIHPLSEIEGSPYIQFEDPVTEAICIANWSSDGVGLTKEDAAAVTSIGTVFKGNTEITNFDELKYFTNVKKITNSAFYGCSQLTSISLENIELIEAYAFGESGLSGIISVPNLTGYLQTGAFYKTNIEEVADLGSITLIQNYTNATGGVFAYCKQLKKVTLPSTLGQIGNYTFYDNSALATVICGATTPPIISNATFPSTLTAIYVPDSSVDAYKAATNWSTYVDRIKPLSELNA